MGARTREIIGNGWFAIFAPAAIALATLGATLFFGSSLPDALVSGIFFSLPVVIGFFAAFFRSVNGPIRMGVAFRLGFFSTLVAGTIFILFAIEGIICLLMALPLSLPFIALGAVLGRLAAGPLHKKLSQGITAAVLLFLPALLGFHQIAPAEIPLRQVKTSVEIDAPIQKVWETVIAFPKIETPPSGILATGIAYPIEARIEGEGVGAIRHCVFNTGSFVEPITRWEAPTLLAFDVTENPPCMEEISIYKDLDPEHLHNTMVSEKGQFHLTERNGKVILEGTTWYRHHLTPQWYWGPISDYIIHKIHYRVLDHIQVAAEKQ